LNLLQSPAQLQKMTLHFNQSSHHCNPQVLLVLLTITSTCSYNSLLAPASPALQLLLLLSSNLLSALSKEVAPGMPN
jgi:hypothetical protein